MWSSIRSSLIDSQTGSRTVLGLPRWSSTIACARSMHSLQISTPGPATSLSTSVLGLAQKEHLIVVVAEGGVMLFYLWG